MHHCYWRKLSKAEAAISSFIIRRFWWHGAAAPIRHQKSIWLGNISDAMARNSASFDGNVDFEADRRVRIIDWLLILKLHDGSAHHIIFACHIWLSFHWCSYRYFILSLSFLFHLGITWYQWIFHLPAYPVTSPGLAGLLPHTSLPLFPHTAILSAYIVRALCRILSHAVLYVSLRQYIKMISSNTLPTSPSRNISFISK